MDNNKQAVQPPNSRQEYRKPLLVEEKAFSLVTGASIPFKGFMPSKQQEGEA
jgi:hypothetical protein